MVPVVFAKDIFKYSKSPHTSKICESTMLCLVMFSC